MKSNAAFTALLVSAFLCLGFVGIMHHEMWRDELQPWLIGRDSSSIKNLFDNLRYEGHPGLWYAILYVLSRFTHDPAAMQVSHLMIAAGTVYLFARFSPFTKAQKVLFSFGYFPFYEYGIISRNYALGILCIFSFCALFPMRTKSYLIPSSILLVLANTSVYGSIIAMSLGLTLLFESVIDERMRRSLSARKWDLISSLLIFAFGIVIAIFQVIPPRDRALGFAGKGLAGFQPSRLIVTLTIIWGSYIPIPDFFTYHFWNTNIVWNTSLFPSLDVPTHIRDINIRDIVCAVLSLGLLAFSLALFARKPVPCFSYLSGTFGILAFTYLIYFGRLVHHGHLFILFVACVWISRYYGETRPPIRFVESFADSAHRFGNRFVMVLLYAHLAAGIIAFRLDFFNPFSASKEVSSFIKGNHLADMLIVGSIDYAASPLSGFLDRKIYYPESDRFGSFIIWDSKRKKVSPHELLEKVRELIAQRKRAILLVLNHRLGVRRDDLSVFELSEFTRSIVPDEKYYVYLAQNKDI